jgi:hypothetical protein
MRVRRSADDAQLDIPLATAVQTRTNLMPVPLVDNGPPVGGITVTQLGSGVEFGQPYIDVRWQGTATASGALVFRQGPGGIYNPAVHAAVTPGLVYTASLGYRLIGGTAPTQQLSIRLIQRAANATGISFGTVYNLPAPTAALRRAVAMDVILSGVTYAHAQFGYSLAINDTVDVTLRLYANNLEQAIGNLRPATWTWKRSPISWAAKTCSRGATMFPTWPGAGPGSARARRRRLSKTQPQPLSTGCLARFHWALVLTPSQRACNAVLARDSFSLAFPAPGL